LENATLRLCGFSTDWSLKEEEIRKPDVLKRLVISYINQAASSSSLATAISDLLDHTTTLEELSINRTSGLLTKDRMVELAPKLTSHPTLKQLNLSSNDIEDDDLVVFCHVLDRNRRSCHLEKLSLKPNPWTEGIGAKALLHTMEHNHTIVYLDSLLGLSPATVKKLRYYAWLNRAGHKLVVEAMTATSCTGEEGRRSDAPIPIALWPLVLERADGKISYYTEGPQNETLASVSSIYYIMRNMGPMLVGHRPPPPLEVPTVA
jgi:hypothetical protein